MKKAFDQLKNNYIVVQSWMVRELGLKGNDALIYALIYGFSQADGQVCSCGDEYMAAWIGASTRTVIHIKNSLLSAGLIEKAEGFDGDQRYSGYTVVRSKIGEKTSCKSLPTVNKTCEKISLKSKKLHEKASCNTNKIGENFSEIGENFSPDNKLYNFQTDKSVCQSTRACARTRRTDGRAEKEFLRESIQFHLEKLDDPYKADYAERLENIVTELMRWNAVKVNGVDVSTTKILHGVLDLFRDPEKLRTALFAGCKKEVKRKFNYTVAALYNAANQF